MDNSMFVRTEINKKRMFIKVEQFTKESYFERVFQAFDLDRNGVYDIHITDHLGTYIDPEDLIDILKIYNTSDFTLRLKITRKSAATNAVVDPQSLQTYIAQQELGHLIFEEYDQSDTLTDQTRKKLVKYMANYVLSIGGGKYDISNLRSVVRAAIPLFPYFKAGFSDDEGIMSLPIYTYVKNKIYNLTRSEPNSPAHEPAPIDINNNFDVEEEAMLARKIKLPEGIEELKCKLRLTSQYRKRLLENVKTDLEASFPYFFSHGELILFEHELLCETMQYHPTKNFMNEWEYFSSKIVQIKEMNTVWQTDIEIFLFLLKEFAPKSGRLGVLERIRKLIVFNKIGKPIEVIPSNIHPYIVACGQSSQQISHYFISVEQHLMKVPRGTSFAQVFDIYFKVHDVFNLHYDKNIWPLILFMKVFIYKYNQYRTQLKPTTRMVEIAQRVSAVI